MEYHIPVLSSEVLSALNVQSDNIYVDATLGNGGHTLEILKQGGVVYGIDQDIDNLKKATKRIQKENLEKNFHPIHDNFVNLETVVNDTIGHKVNGILFDLGLSQNQQTAQNRGFSFNDTASLDMRLDPSQELTAENIINTYHFEELYEIFTKYVQEQYSKPLILRIISERQKKPIKTAERLANIIRNYYQEKHIKSKIDPSTKIFLALRIAVNNEFDNLKDVLNQTLTIVSPGGTVCVISFHSGEDRIVKQFIRSNISRKLIESNNKTVVPTFQEIKINPLSRSAILRSYKII